MTSNQVLYGCRTVGETAKHSSVVHLRGCGFIKWTPLTPDFAMKSPLRWIVERNARRYGFTREPILGSDLENECLEEKEKPDWHPRALERLAKQLGFFNDYYFPLIGAAEKLRNQPNP